MPLKKGSSRKAVNENIRTEKTLWQTTKQAVAIALIEARKSGPKIPKRGNNK